MNPYIIKGYRNTMPMYAPVFNMWNITLTGTDKHNSARKARFIAKHRKPKGK
jgi:hypothetical protein